jgi:hypothetical protein
MNDSNWSEKSSASLGSDVRRGSELLRLERARRPPIATGVEPFDRLQGGGLARGSLVELAGARSSGRLTLAFAALAAATSAGEAAAFVDAGDELDPQGAQAAGADLSKLLWMRPKSIKEALLSAEQALWTGFALVVLDLGEKPLRGFIPSAAWLRLSRSARAQSSAFLVVTPRPLCGSAADVLALVGEARAMWRGTGAAPKLLSGVSAQMTVRRRGGFGESGGTLLLGGGGR